MRDALDRGPRSRDARSRTSDRCTTRRRCVSDDARGGSGRAAVFDQHASSCSTTPCRSSARSVHAPSGQLAGLHRAQLRRGSRRRCASRYGLALAGLGQRAAVFADLLVGEIADVRLAVDRTSFLGELVHPRKVRPRENSTAPRIEAEPAHARACSIDRTVLDVLLSPGSCRRGSAGCSVPPAGRARCRSSGRSTSGVPDVEIAVRLRRGSASRRSAAGDAPCGDRRR